MESQTPCQPYYEIQVEGELGEMWMEWFEPLSIRREFNAESNQHVTVLFGTIPDQPALYSVLNKIRDLNLSLISIKKCEPK